MTLIPGQSGKPAVKLTPVDAKSFEAVGYSDFSRQLYIKFSNAPMLCFEDVPNFRYAGLMAAPRKDAYFNAHIKDRFLVKEVTPPA
jgi:hypothetical protein